MVQDEAMLDCGDRDGRRHKGCSVKEVTELSSLGIRSVPAGVAPAGEWGQGRKPRPLGGTLGDPKRSTEPVRDRNRETDTQLIGTGRPQQNSPLKSVFKNLEHETTMRQW